MPNAPLHTGVGKAILWGAVAAGVVAIAGTAIATIAGTSALIGAAGSLSAAAGMGSAATTAILASNPVVVGVLSATNALVAPLGVINGVKTLFEERHKYKQAHSMIDTQGSQLEGRVSSVGINHGKG
jgi:phosphoribosylformylglycinamidine (FGAM) synthase-like amidotransferase family enzyme